MSFVRELRDKYLDLGNMALAFPLVPRYEDRGVRHRVHGSYQIFYRVVGQPAERIDVIRVRTARVISARYYFRRAAGAVRRGTRSRLYTSIGSQA